MNLATILQILFCETIVFSSERVFKIWDYSVSHRQLLLRSPKSEKQVDNVDVVFWGVEFISIPSILNGLSLRQVGEDEVVSFRPSALKKNALVIRIDAGTEHGFVEAAGCKILENQVDIFDSSLVYFETDRTLRNYGRVVAKIPASS